MHGSCTLPRWERERERERERGIKREMKRERADEGHNYSAELMDR